MLEAQLLLQGQRSQAQGRTVVAASGFLDLLLLHCCLAADDFVDVLDVPLLRRVDADLVWLWC